MTEGTKPSISTVRFSELEDSWRVDAEYYQPAYFEMAAMLEAYPATASLDALSGGIVCGPFGSALSKAEYTHSGVPLVRVADLSDFIVTSNRELVFVSEETAKRLDRYLIEAGDIAVSQRGTIAMFALMSDDFPNWLISANLIAVRKSQQLNPFYLNVFLNSKYGTGQLHRLLSGQIQPKITTDDVKSIVVPIPPVAFQDEIEQLVRKTQRAMKRAPSLYRQAEQLLLDELGLSNLDRSIDLFGEANVFDAFCASRIDSDFFEPKYDRLLKHLHNLGAQPVGDVARLRQEKFSPQKGVNFSYIEISNVNLNNGLCHASEIPGEEAPDRAQQIVRTGDIVVSTVQPLRSGIALIHPNQDGFVCSSGFAVLEPLSVFAEYLLVYLRLKPIRELLNRSNRASMYPAVTASDVLNLPIIVSADNELTVRGLIQESHRAYFWGLKLLEQARHKVEALIESEAAHG